MERTRESFLSVIKELPFFDTFTDEEVRIFSQYLRLRQVADGTILFQQGDYGDYLFFIIDGMMEISLKADGKQHKVIASYGPGNSVGEMALIDDFERSAMVRAATDCEILILTRTTFEKVLTEHPALGIKVLKGLAKNISIRLRAAHGRFRDII